MSPLPLHLSPWQALYSALHERRRNRQKSRSKGLPLPVISIGNLHWGGTGKTPLCRAVASWLLARGHRPAILSRGYGRSSREPLIVSSGRGPEAPVSQTGDEPWELAESLPGVAVIVAPKRFEAGRMALAELEPNPDVFLLDDGFSHTVLRRDLDILAFPAVDPLGGGKLFPGGRLREPLAAARHADAVVLTGLGSQERRIEAVEPRVATDPRTGRQLAERLRAVGFAGPGFNSELRTELKVIAGATPEPSDKRQRALLVTGVARPLAVSTAAKANGIEVVEHLVFRDHHTYPERTIELIQKTFRRLRQDDAVDTVLVTVKDRVKLQGRLDLPLAELVARAHLERAFVSWLDEELSGRGLDRVPHPAPAPPDQAGPDQPISKSGSPASTA